MVDKNEINQIVEWLLPLYTMPSELSNTNATLRESLRLLAERLTLSFEQDNFGNIYLTTSGRDPHLSPLGVCFPLDSTVSSATFKGALRVFLALQSRSLSCAIPLIGWSSLGDDLLGKKVWEGLVSSEEGYSQSPGLKQFASMPSISTFAMSALFEIKATSDVPMVIEGSPLLVEKAVSASNGSVETIPRYQDPKRAPGVTIKGHEAVIVGQSTVELYSKYVAALFDNFD